LRHLYHFKMMSSRHYVPGTPAEVRPLIVRLRNWVGDVVLSIPTLERLAATGYALELIGKRWAADLLEGYGWNVHALPNGLQARVAQLRALRATALQHDPQFTRRINMLSMPFSFSNALESRTAGLNALGYAHEARGLLLHESLAQPKGLHELELLWRLGDAVVARALDPPRAIGYRVSQSADQEARALQRLNQLEAGRFLVICPFAGGAQSKIWPEFEAWVSHDAATLGLRLVVCPSPSEEFDATRRFPTALILRDVRLGVYAALMRDAALIVANDTGPGHLAAAVGTPVVSVMGPTNTKRWHPWGPSARCLGGDGVWPLRTHVTLAVRTIRAQQHTAQR
jgi:heptosyltransferase II